MPQLRQPFLHDLVCVLAAPTQAWSSRAGQIEPGPGGAGVQGLIHADVRVLSQALLLVDDARGEHVSTTLTRGGDGDLLQITALHRELVDTGTLGPDSVLRSDRFRQVRPGRMTERIVLSSVLTEPVQVTLAVWISADLLSVEHIKQGRTGSPAPIRVDGSACSWGDGRVTARLRAAGSTITTDEAGAEVYWDLEVPARGAIDVAYDIEVGDTGGVVAAAPPVTGLGARIESLLAMGRSAAESDRRVRPWAERSLADLAALRMVRPESAEDVFYAAGAPWYFTLFGRDSLISARFMLPVDPAIAVGTLRTLAALQGRVTNPETAEEPGKIMHELRRAGTSFLPPLYYGTVDATPLWICVLHDVWMSGEAPAAVEELLPNLEAALRWLTTYGDADGDGFIEYLDASGRGLVNQGWKDSADAVRFADGTIATGPVALCEVQGYAYEAALGGAAMLEAYGLPGSDDLRVWATNLAARFRERFWVRTRGRRFPALALDGTKRPVDALTSNIGHLLGTGILNPAEEREVAALVSGPELDSGLGLRTMSSADGGYAPLSYHCGSVWPHDTAMVIAGLLRAGLATHARGLAEGLVAAAAAFDDRVPELYSGEGRPVPYPASCRPQAWAAAAVVPVLQALGELSRPS